MSIQKIFFSYSRIDGSDFALKLAVDLKKEGFKIWIDQQDIRAGSEWDIEIEKALETCDCLLFIETEKSVSSNNVLDEVYYVLEQHKKIIPLILRDSKTPFRLQRIQHIDFSKEYDSGLALLIKELKNDITTEVFEPEEVKSDKVNKPIITRYAALILIIISLVVIIAAVLFYKVTTQNKNAEVNKADNKVANLNETFAGKWKLTDVDPKAESTKGFLNIEVIDEKKVNVKSYMQFYYFKTNDTSFLSVFNAFAGCSSCVLDKKMKLTAEDIAIGSQTYKISKQDRPGGGKAGDTIMNAGSNKSIPASVTLDLINNNTVVIKVERPLATALSYGLVLEPFVYSFTFRKIDY